ncbi:type I-E CRISPR-associated protein Cas5/CasD [Rhodomicrobium vannielii ATCC 17100]|uniref:type I-E CRISPR-associated protein Cas5/CasD n=1 Tax=Rhodomicrobium vannielii TaxID=1069 RepID=UPI001918D62D|nr:type I-E CRISPR-associated protein Cas5/CasD [Rhodomicrobium vannielii]MBJ7533136.1 type I-E CRISPR-associated protein Cas5/CasD [Rhodomicrobium vannielii ATCC 17100]
MRNYLVFTIAAPMASFGMKYDPGEWRNSSNRPSKSGVLGLVAAALGIEREEQARFDALRDSLGFAVRVDQPGQTAYDYHTAQVPPQKRNRRFATRADELAVPKHELKTVLSTREYRTNAFATPALWFRAGVIKAHFSLWSIAAALKQPRFNLYAGRKSHPLMLPCAPEVIEAGDALAAFTAYDAATERLANFQEAYLGRESDPKRRPAATIYCDADDPAAASSTRIEQRRDVPESRTKWRFGVRQEAVIAPRGGQT